MFLDADEILKEVEDYLKKDLTSRELIRDSTSFIESYDLIKAEISTVSSKITFLNDKLKAYDLIDFFYSKSISTNDLGIVNKLLQDLKIVEKDVIEDGDYSKKHKAVYLKTLEVGSKLVKDKIENGIEAFYSNNDLMTYVTLLENKEEVMGLVIEKRRKSCNLKIQNFVGDEKIFYYMLVNHEILLWSLLFPCDLNVILRRLHSLMSPLGYSKFEKFVYAIFKVYFEDQAEEELKGLKEEAFEELKDTKVLESYVDVNSKLIEINNYSEHSSIHSWFYNAFFYKSLRDYLSDGVVEI